MTRPAYFFDLGNTRAKLWRCQGRSEEAYWAGVHDGSPERLVGALPPAFDDLPSGVFGVSVLGPEVEKRFRAAVLARWGVVPEFARTGASFGLLRNAYRDEPERLGVDRWLGMIGAAGDCDVLCVVGCGTAITIDVVATGVHRGGYILPGLRLMQDSLLTGTQRVRFDGDSPYAVVPGASTAEAVRNATILAVVATVERVVSKEGVGRLVLTGGDAAIVAGFLQVPCEVDPGLLLKGMMRYFAHRNGSPSEGVSQEVGG